VDETEKERLARSRAETIAAAPPDYDYEKKQDDDAAKAWSGDFGKLMLTAFGVVLLIAVVGAIGSSNSDGGSTYTPPPSSYTSPSGSSGYAECVAAGQSLDRALADDGYAITDPAQHARAMQQIRNLCRNG
jgi:hypothetical protein